MALTPYYQEPGIVIYHANALEVLPQLEAGEVNLVLTDPPYGCGTRVDNRRFSGGTKTGPRTSVKIRTPVIGDATPFDPVPLLRFPRLVLFGANWYASKLPASGGWIVWDKRKGLEHMENWPFSEAELAWTNLSGAVRVFRNRWMGLVRDSERGEFYHPTQKPVALMMWIINRWTQPGDVVLDPYCGSGPVLQAAKELGRCAIGIEICLVYCDIAVQRLQQEVLPLESVQLIQQRQGIGQLTMLDSMTALTDR